MKKKLYTREEFEEFRQDAALRMVTDGELFKESLKLLNRADSYHWIHQTTWFGQPVLNLAQDMFAIQEIIFETRPKYVIEVGVAWGGSLLFYSTLMEALGGEKIIGIDTYIPEDLNRRLSAYGKLSERIVLINDSSVEKSTIQQVKGIIGNCRDVMVILDSHHTHYHVLQELCIYSEFVGKGYYLVCSDTIIEYLPEEQIHRPRPWGHGNNPATALDFFLKQDDCFEVDSKLESKLLLSCHPGGYLKRHRD